MIENSTAELEAYKGLPYVENVETLHTHGYTGMNQLLARFLDCFTDTSK
jgi:hypothetical protein